MISILSSLMSEWSELAVFSVLSTSAFLISAGIFIHLFYHEFFIGEKPKEWLTFSLGLSITGALIPLNLAYNVFGELSRTIIVLAQLIGPIIIFMGSFKIHKSAKEVF